MSDFERYGAVLSGIGRYGSVFQPFIFTESDSDLRTHNAWKRRQGLKMKPIIHMITISFQISRFSLQAIGPMGSD